VSNSVAFKLIGAPGGTLIDPSGSSSAVHALHETYGDRMDWDDLLEHFEERAGILEFEGKLERAEAERIAADSVRAIVEARRARPTR
jgi:hypothetical protein